MTERISQRAAKRYRREWRALWAWLRRTWNADVPNNTVYIGAVALTEYQQGRLLGASLAYGDAMILARPNGAKADLYVVQLEDFHRR